MATEHVMNYDILKTMGQAKRNIMFSACKGNLKRLTYGVARAVRIS